jgi:2-oxo-4-hydroxy-4-carboxy-5-ureidoimidazoline decarboxylase
MEPWQRVDLASAEEARARLSACCGSSTWVERMMQRRPFGSTDALLAAARDEWFALAEDDWREAFRQHPKIGDRAALCAPSGVPAARTLRGGVGSGVAAARTLRGGGAVPDTAHLSSAEQSGVTGASDDILDALAQGNREYEEKFGFIFIVCATGKSAAEMLGLLRARLPNPPDREIRIAASEQAQITELRLLAA